MAGSSVGDFKKMLENAKDEDLIQVEMIPNYRINIVAAPKPVESSEIASSEEKASDPIEAKVD